MDIWVVPTNQPTTHRSPLTTRFKSQVSPLDGAHWFSEWLVFEGISVDEDGKQHFMDASLAFKMAVLNAINYLSKFGYSREQVRGGGVVVAGWSLGLIAFWS